MEWTRGRTVGRGSTAVVSLATSAESGEVFAVKSAELGASASLQREQQILSSLASPRVVEYRGFGVTREGGDGRLTYNLFMEFVPGGTLADLTRKLGGRLSQPAIARYARQILEGLEHLHSRGIAHCDVKGSNILMGEDGPKLADLGCARRVDDPAAAAEAEAPFGGTPMYMSPEVARGEEQGRACDVWALGCTVVEMATGGAPWRGGDPASVLYKIAYSGESPEIPGWLSEGARDFLGKCLRRDPRGRWTPRQLLGHSFLLGECESESELDFRGAKRIREWESSASTSPTSVLDRGAWSSAAEPETSAAGHDGACVGDETAADRIRRLSASSVGPRSMWDGDGDGAEGDWIDVRGCVDDDVGNEEPADSSIGWSEVDAVGGKVGGEALNGAMSRDALRAWDCGEIGFAIRNSDHMLLRPLMT